MFILLYVFLVDGGWDGGWDAGGGGGEFSSTCLGSLFSLVSIFLGMRGGGGERI